WLVPDIPRRTRSAGPSSYGAPYEIGRTVRVRTPPGLRAGRPGRGPGVGWGGGRRAGSAAEHGAVGDAVGGAGLVEGDLADRAHAGAEGPVARDAEGGRLAQARDAVGEAGLEVADPLEEPAVQVDGGDVGGLHEPAVLAEVVDVGAQ